ncbi:MAG: ParA family protein [Candidatus Thiosymbion ectosymbiont of Robbea hypermnestra]|nr:ParA family protein [Candidatus Thiosymbion ectosymbiont of Robbea hypermnestra]
MGTIVGFASEKGGVGKTTICYHLAVALSRYHGKKVLVIDGDYQRGGITGRFDETLIEGFRTGQIQGPTLYNKFLELYSAQTLTPDIKIFATSEERIHFVPADPRLSAVTVDKIPTTNNIRENMRSLWRHLSVLEVVLAPIRDRYDYILVDSHPDINDLLRTILYACEYVCSPVKLDLQSTVGVVSAIEAINNVNSDIELVANTIDETIDYSPTQYAGAIATQAREWGGILKWTERTEYRRIAQSGPIFETYVTEGDGLRQAARDRCPVFDISGQNAEKQSQQLRELTKEFIERCPA